LLDAQGHVGADFFDQAFQICRAGTELPSLPASGPVINRELHLDGRRNRSGTNGTANARGIGDRFADETSQTGQPDHASGVSFRNLDRSGLSKWKMPVILETLLRPSPWMQTDEFAHLDLAAVNFPKGDSPRFIGVVQVGDPVI